MPLADDTELIIERVGPSRYSARGLEQTLRPDPLANGLERSISGGFVDFSMPQFRKYVSTITCRDMRLPMLDNVWQGEEVVVDCACYLAHEAGTGEAGREVVPGSEIEEEGTVYYRPRLTMVIADWRITYDEWGAETGWELELWEA